ncbi:ClbS/DfsB family four-helix bundle protein [Bisgaard Taxon 45]
MHHYESKTALKNAIQQAYEKYLSEFDVIPETLKDEVCPETDRTPAQNLAYQVGWTSLLISWEQDERKGLPVKTPSDQFKWNQLGELYQWFNQTYAHLSLTELKNHLAYNIQILYNLMDTMSDEALFSLHQRKWADDATKKAKWTVSQFIHVNTVAPLTTFRTKIRKWKKHCL